MKTITALRHHECKVCKKIINPKEKCYQRLDGLLHLECKEVKYKKK